MYLYPIDLFHLTMTEHTSTYPKPQKLQNDVMQYFAITNIKDIENLCAVEHEGITGAITGRAIYEGTLDFIKAQQYSDQFATQTAAK